MRLGMNPAKENPQLAGYLRHRVIIPIYTPSQTGYFTQSLEILKLCLESLRRTIAGRAHVTLISNSSAPEVVAYLNSQYTDGWVDQLIVNRQNRGKVDAVVSVARGAFEEFLTIADADVFFKANWLTAVESIFRIFPECGVVAPVPQPLLAWHCTSATVLGALVKRELKFAKVMPEEDWDRFALSIGRPDLCKGVHRQTQLIVERAGTVACVGGGHFVFTMRRSVVAGMPAEPSLNAIEGDSEARWLDIPPDRLGLWHLATPQAHAYHLGNTVEAWMYEELQKLEHTAMTALTESPQLPAYRAVWPSYLPWKVRNGLVKFLRLSGTYRISRRVLRLPAEAIMQLK